MIQAPTKIEDSSNKKFSFRPNYSDTGKIRLKPFVSDYNRINNYLSIQKQELEKYPIKRSKILNNKSQTINYEISDNEEETFNEPVEEKKVNKYYYLQPVMKFAPRTEFERIYDTINSYNYGSVDKNIILDQLKSLGFLTIQNNKSLENQNEYSLIKEKFKVTGQTLSYLINEKARLEREPKTPQTNELIANITDIIKINRQIKHDQEKSKIPLLNNNHKTLNIAQKKIINNYLAKHILGQYQKKTHFKALLNFTLDLDKKETKSKSPLYNKKDIKSLYANNTFNDINKFFINNYNSEKTLIKNTCVKPFHKKKKYPKEDLEYLKKLCITEEHNNGPKNAYKSQNDDIEDESKNILKSPDVVIINGVKYQKNKDINKISRAVLKECNYIKNDFDIEYAGDGKTMITRGLSVDQFTKKYGLPK